MDQLDKDKAARLIRDARSAKGITQQELSDLSGISLRSVQRIENGEVVPRVYTLRILFAKLGITETLPLIQTPSSTPATIPTHTPESSIITSKSNRPRKLILTIAAAILIILAVTAFIAQSPRFPETDFERILLWMGALGVYTLLLLRIWK